MKSFLYMDVDKINSIIAQAEKGITINEKSEETNSKGSNINASANVGAEGKAEFSILKLINTGTNFEGKVGLEGELEYNKVLRNITEKKIHDEIFEKACKYISINENENIQDDYGEYVRLNKVFQFIDLDYLEKLFSKDGIIEIIIESEQKKMEEEFKRNLNREQERKSKNEIEKLKKEVVKNYEEIEKLIKGFKNVVPYTKMLISHDGYLIPLEEKNFRVNSSTMGFMYNGEISCVGMITNIIGDDIADSDDSNNIFGAIQKTINAALKTILPTKERNLCIVNPIAIFYDN